MREKKGKQSEVSLLRDALGSGEYRCFGREIDLRHDYPDDMIEESEMALFRAIRISLPEIIGIVERQVRSCHQDEEPKDRNFCEPRLNFEDPDYRDDPDEWTFVVGRRDWEDYSYHLRFLGSKFIELQSGD